jgi:hypothetical protein
MNNPLEEFDPDTEDNNPLLGPPKKKKIEEIILSKEQELIILKEWEKNPENPPSVNDLIRLCWPDIEEEMIDGRSSYGKIIKEYLTSKFGSEIAQVAIQTYKPKKEIELSTEQIEYITNNCSTMKPFEMAKEVFQNPKLSPASAEVRLVINLVKSLPQSLVYGDEEELELEYKPPKLPIHVIARINKYVKDSKIDKDKPTPTHKKQCDALINYLHDYRLIHQINTYESISDKKLFESSFITYCWDKSDLSAEDVHQYIILCTEVVMSASIQRTINTLQIEQDRILNEEGKVPMALVELIGNTRNDYNASVKRHETLIKSLTTERSKRLKDRIGPEFTLLNIVEEFKKEESRMEWIQEAEERNKRIGKEIDRLSKFDEGIVRIFGINSDLVFNG